MIPGFRIIRHLGAGGMGSVYLGEDEQLGRMVAIKLVASGLAGEAEAQARFRREARAMATVEHPNVVRVYSFGEADGMPFLVMEFVDGETLAARLRRVGPLPEADALAILRAVVAALQVAWDKGIVHRDLKPANVLLDTRGTPRVADFGLAKVVRLSSESSLTGSGYLLGTPHYASPEQAQGGEVDHRSDIYSLGIMLFEMVTGRRPFEGPTPFAVVDHHLHSDLPDPRRFSPGLSEVVCRLISRMTQKAADNRPQSYDEVLELADAADSAASTTILARAARTRATAWRSVAGWAGLILMTGLAVATHYLVDREPPRASAKAPPSGRLTIAIAPFSGPDEDSVKEGRVMSALVERAVHDRLASPGVRVLGADTTRDPIRTPEAAQALGEQVGAQIVVWGEVLAFRKEIEVQPHLTIVTARGPGEVHAETAAALSAADFGGRTDLVDLAADRSDWAEAFGGRSLKLESEAANQIELHRTSAAGIGDMVVVLAALNALTTEHNPAEALRLVQPLPETSDRLYVEAVAQLQAGRRDLAIAALHKATTIDPLAAQSFALLGDILFEANNRPAALAAYHAAAVTGRPYTATRAILYEDLLYFPERYSSEFTGSDEIETLYVLGADPTTGTIRERYALPGIARRFRTTPTGLEIAWVAPFGHREYPGTVQLRDHHLDRPVLPGKNLLLQIRSMRSGWWRAANFLNDLVGYPQKAVARFAPEGILYRGVPANLHDLRVLLTQALSEDPTQPWHLLFLGLTDWELGDQASAQAAWGRVVAERFAGTPYYEFAWMASFLENTGHEDWADKVYKVASAKRSALPVQPDLVERIYELYHFPPIRVAAVRARALHESARGYLWLRRARATVGMDPVLEPSVSALWRRELRLRGDREGATYETSIQRRLGGTAAGASTSANLVDFGLYACASTAILLGALLPLCLAGRSPRLPRPTARNNTSISPVGLWSRIPAPLRIPAAIVVSSMGLVGLASLAIKVWTGPREAKDALSATAPVVFIAVLAVMFTIRVSRAGVRGAARSISWGRLSAILAAGTFALVCYVAFAVASARLNAWLTLPSGLPESLADPLTCEWLEQRLALVHTSDAVFAAAVSNQLGGNWDRAEELYRQLGSASAAQQNLSAVLARDARPRVGVARDVVFRLALPHGWAEWSRALARPERPFRRFHIGFDAALTTLLGLLRVEMFACLILVTLWVGLGGTKGRDHEIGRPPGSDGHEPSRWPRRRLSDFVAQDPLRATSTLFALLLGTIGLVGAFVFSRHTFGLGPVSAELSPRVVDVVPLPARNCAGQDAAQCYRAELFWLQPNTKAIVGLLSLGLLAGVILTIQIAVGGRRESAADDRTTT